MVKDDTAISLGALDAKYGLPLYDVGDEEPEQGIYRNVNPDELGFKTTAELKAPEGLERILGQEEAVSAIMEGLAIQRPDYNLIIQCGSEQDVPLLIKVIREEYAKKAEVRNVDQIAWQNFSNPITPKTGCLPAGYAAILKNSVKIKMEELSKYTPDAKSMPGFEKHMAEVTKRMGESDGKIKMLEDEAMKKLREEGIECEKAYSTIIIRHEGKLEGEKKKKANEIMAELKKKTAREILAATKGNDEFIKSHELPALGKAILKAGETILSWHEEMAEEGKFPADMLGVVKEYITDIFTYAAAHSEMLKDKNEEDMSIFSKMFGAGPEKGIEQLLPHILIDNTGKAGLITIVETDPDPSSLLGSIEYAPHKPSHMRLNPGLLARANKGLLVISHADWSIHPRGIIKYKLLEALETGKANIGGLSIFDKVDAKADANTKLMLFVSDVGKYFSRFEENDRFTAYFKKRITLERRVPMSAENIAKLARAVKGEVVDSKLPDFENSAVARLAEYLMLPFGKDKMSTDVSFYRDLLVRAGISAKNAGREIATREDIDLAYKNYKQEKNNYERAFREYIKKGFFIIRDKPEVGVVNGLAYLGTEIPFGRSLRIGVTVRPNKDGSGRFVNIDEKAELSGEMFTKSFLQVASMMRELYQKEDVQMHFDLETSISQSDHGINGPSAGAAMSLACISAIAEIPVRPHVFFTGGIDPKSGNVTVIGGATEKVMGVYYTCRDLGIKDGIAVIPKTNAGDLQLLEPEVHEAIRKGEFRVYTHAHIDETIEIGTGMKAKIVHRKAGQRLKALNRHYERKNARKR